MEKSTKINFITKSNIIHKNKYDYSLVEYINNKTRVKIICKEHGIFEQRPDAHIYQKQGCQECYKYSNLEQFIKKSNKIHNNKYDYSKSILINSKTPIEIICPIHNSFFQNPTDHTMGHGCPKCKNVYNYTTKEIIEKFELIHHNKYDYSSVEYINMNTKVKIICKKHGIFEQYVSDHLNKCECPKCNGKNLTIEDIKNNFNIIHNNKYDYSKFISFKKQTDKIEIICPIHKNFFQSIYSHKIKKQGCPHCRDSKGELKIVEFLSSNNINYTRNKSFDDCVYIQKLKFDFYLYEYNTCIEFDGEQHFRPVSIFGGDDQFIINKIRDNIKNEYCKNKNINLIRIKYNENIMEKLNKLILNLRL